MARPVAVLDANVLYPARLRDLFAAAIAGEADLLVTWNVADFPLESPSDVGFRS